MPKLSDTQLVILSNAAQRDGGGVLPPPKRLKVKGGALTSALKSLIRKGLVEEVPAPPDAQVWRESEDTRLMLTISSAGLEAIGVEPEVKEPVSHKGSKAPPTAPVRKRTSKASNQTPKAVPVSVRPGTKIALLIEMLSRDGSATIIEIVEAIGWQQHSVRGAISGTVKKKLGFTISSETTEGRGRVYQIARAG